MLETEFFFQTVVILVSVAGLSVLIQVIKQVMGKGSSPRSLGIRILSAWYLWLAVWYALHLNDPNAILVMGFQLPIMLLFSYQLILMVFCVGLSLGIWHLRESFRRLGIGFETYLMIDALMILMNPVTLLPFMNTWIAAGFTRAEALIYLSCQSVLLGAYAAIRLGFLIKQRKVFKNLDPLEKYLQQAWKPEEVDLLIRKENEENSDSDQGNNDSSSTEEDAGQEEKSISDDK